VSEIAVSSSNNLLHRLRSSLGWIAAQFWATPLLVLAGIGWTRLPDKHSWQVGLSLLLPLVLLIAVLLLQAGTMRRLIHDEQRRTPFLVGAFTLLVWVLVAWVAWAVLDWCDDQIPIWAGYLNSRFGAGERATIFTYDHLESWLTFLVWICRWIALPAKLIPHAMGSANWGWRLPWRRTLRLVFNWQWWLAVIVAAIAAVELPSHFFANEPSGTVSHQVWSVALKLVGAYLLAVVSWVLLLVWAAVLLNRPKPATAHPADEAPVPVPVGSGPHSEDSVKLPLPESGNDAGGNI